MSDWSNVWQGIGLLGQTKKGMHTPVIDAHRNRGRVASEGLGRISDTLGGMKDRQFITSERKEGEAYQTSEREAKELYDSSENALNRLQDDKALDQAWDIAVMDDKGRRDLQVMAQGHQATLQREQNAWEAVRQGRELTAAEERIVLQLEQASKDLRRT